MIPRSALPVAPPAGGGAPRHPDVRQVGGEDVVEVALALHAERRERRDVEGARPEVAVLDEQPAPAVLRRRRVGPVAGADQYPRPLELVPVEGELQVALAQGFAHAVDLRPPGAVVPQHHDALAVAFRDHPFEVAVVAGMILGPHRQVPIPVVERRPLRHRPRQQNPAVLEPQVVVQPAREGASARRSTAASARPPPVRAAGRLPAARGSSRNRACGGTRRGAWPEDIRGKRRAGSGDAAGRVFTGTGRRCVERAGRSTHNGCGDTSC